MAKIPQGLLFLFGLLIFVVVQTGRGYKQFYLAASTNLMDLGMTLESIAPTIVNDTMLLLKSQTAHDSVDQGATLVTEGPPLVITEPDNKTSLIPPLDNNHMAGCLLVMDENFRLTEWLAYHYHVLPLQRLIVAIDPNSKTFPHAVLQMFRDELGMNITTWDDKDFGDWEPLPPDAAISAIRDRHRHRQMTFLQMCMSHLAEEGWTWTALWDTDEYLTYMKFGSERKHHKRNVLLKAPQDLEMHGNAMAYLHAYGEEYCVPMYRVLIGAQENKTLLEHQQHIVPYKRLDTIRYRYRNKFDNKLNGNGKCLVNVQFVERNVTVRTVHRPAMKLCQAAAWGLAKNNAFLIHHYIGSWEAYSYRDDARKGWDRSWEAWQYRSEAASVVHDDGVVSWLPGFAKHVGLEKAKRILNQAGLPPDYDATDKIEEYRCKIGPSCKRLAGLGFAPPNITISLKEERLAVEQGIAMGDTPVVTEKRTTEGETSEALKIATNATTTEQRPEVPIDPEGGMAACLLVKDDNFRMYEWLSYHYHVLPLRRMIVAVDPSSQSSPDEVFDLFRQELNMSITTWADSDFGTWEALAPNASTSDKRERHRERQKYFLQACMRELAMENQTFTALWDTDEFIRFNGYNTTITNPKLNVKVMTPSDLTERGSVFKYLMQYGETDCVPIYRVLVGGKETSETTMKGEEHPFDYRRFDTLRFRYRNKYDDKLNGNGKVLLNVQKVQYDVVVRTVHRPAMNICQAPAWIIAKNNPFIIQHYLGSWEAYSYRDDARKGFERSIEAYDLRSQKASLVYDTSTTSWLAGFVQNVGLEKATRLLGDAGLSPDLDASDKKGEFKCKRGTECQQLKKIANQKKGGSKNMRSTKAVGMMGNFKRGNTAKASKPRKKPVRGVRA